jgi:hypothetical protein
MALAQRTVVLAKGNTVSDSITMGKVLMRANEEKLTLVPNREFDRRIVLTDEWRAERNMYPVWTGTLVAYGLPTKAGTLSFKDIRSGFTYLFNIPAEHLSLWTPNSVLVAEHGFVNGNLERPTITIEEDGSKRLFRIEEESIIAIHGGFPLTSAMRRTNELGIPLLGTYLPAEESHGTRYLLRARQNSSYVGLVSRGHYACNNTNGLMQGVVAYLPPSKRLGALAYENEAEPASKPALTSA